MSGSQSSVDQNFFDTIRYYDDNAEAFVSQTASANLSNLHNRFLSELPLFSRILDAGSGSGRDTLAFRQLGHDVIAMDASIEMVNATRRTAGEPVFHSTFLEFKTEEKFDGIWACASLLHVPRSELSVTFKRLLQMLKDDGVIFVSFKKGQTEQVRNGRFFNDMTEEQLREHMYLVRGLDLKSVWETDDVRPDRDERWLNAILHHQAER